MLLFLSDFGFCLIVNKNGGTLNWNQYHRKSEQVP